MPPTLRFPLVLNNLPLDSIGCYGTWKSLFPYRKCRDGWDGMGWEGKGCHGMGVGLGRGTPCGKVGTRKRLLPTNHLRHHCGALLASAGKLATPLGLLFASFFFYHLGGAGAFLGQSPKKIRKLNENKSQNGCQKGCICS